MPSYSTNIELYMKLFWYWVRKLFSLDLVVQKHCVSLIRIRVDWDFHCDIIEMSKSYL